MKKLALLLVVVIFCMSVGCAEQPSATCPCLCCQGTTSSNDKTESKPLTYGEWLDFVFPLLKSCYNLSTFVAAENGCTYSIWSKSDEKYVDASFFLLDDIRCADTEQIEFLHQITKSRGAEGTLNMYKFIHSAPTVCATIRIAHSKVTVPAEYTAIDEIIMDVIGQIESIQNSIVSHITENRTTENWEYDRSTLEHDMEIIEMLYAFID